MNTNPAAYLLKCPACKATSRHTPAERDELRAEWSGGKHGGTACPSCDRCAKFVPIQGTVTDTECGPRCTSSIGPVCDCKCGGQNHATDHK